MPADVFISHHTNSSLHIAEAAANRLEAAGVRCWYAPRDTQGDYASDIFDVIDGCRIFLLILNKQASESFDVMNEINIACDRLRKGEDIKIIPFHVADQDISKAAKYYLGRMHWIDALTPPLYKRIEELTDHIIMLLGHDAGRHMEQKQARYRLISRIPQVRDVFEGRDELIDEIGRRFAKGNRLLFLEGIGGIGKSELAKQYAVRNREHYETIVFAQYLSDLRELLCDDEVFLIENFEPEKEYESKEEYYRRKLPALKQICSRQKVLIIVDNFDTDTDEKLSDLALLNCDVIITTRNIHTGFPSLKITAMEDPDVLRRIFEKHYGDVLSGEDNGCLTEMFRLVNHHTYAVELIAKQMNASFLTAKEMLQTLRSGISNAPGEYFSARDAQNSAFGHLCVLFDMGGLSGEEQRIMRYLSLIGTVGINAGMFRQWAELESFDLINTLISRSWIQRREGQKIAFHPMIAEVVRKQLKPDEKNCGTFLQNFAEYLYFSWHRPYEENRKVLDNVMALAEYFPSPDVSALRFFEPIGNYLWQMGKFEEAVRYAGSVYEACIAQIGPDTVEAGIMAKELGGCYFNGGRLEESVAWYERGLRHMLAGKAEDSEDLALCYEKVARCHTWECAQDFDQAEKLFEESLKIRFRNLEALKRGEKRPMFCPYEEFDIARAQRCIGICYMEMGRMYQAKGDYRKALEYTEKFQRIQTELDPENLSTLSYVYFDKGVSYFELGKQEETAGNREIAETYWEKAKSQMMTAAAYNLKMRGEVALDTIAAQEYLGDICTAMNQYDEASNAYIAALEMAKKLLGDKSSKVRRIMEKMKYQKGSV